MSDIERGIKSVSLEKIDQLAKALEVNIIEFFKF
ncbi:helix-turn-helix domain-containing protein (plasmid) [Cetobacterium somerae]